MKKILVIEEDKLSKVYPLSTSSTFLSFSSSREKSKRINSSVRQERTNSRKNFLEKRFLDLSARDIVFQNSSQLLTTDVCVCMCTRISKVHANHGLPPSSQDFSKLSLGREMSLFKAASWPHHRATVIVSNFPPSSRRLFEPPDSSRRS